MQKTVRLLDCGVALFYVGECISMHELREAQGYVGHTPQVGKHTQTKTPPAESRRFDHNGVPSWSSLKFGL